MNVGDYVFIINPADSFYGEKGVICAVHLDFSRRITGYTIQNAAGRWRDYHTTDVQYSTKTCATFTSQMQLL